MNRSDLDVELLERLQERAAHEGRSINELLRGWLESSPVPGQASRPNADLEDYQALQGSSPYCILSVDLDGRLTAVNCAGTRMTGLRDAADDIPVPGEPYLSMVGTGDRARVGELLSRAVQGQKAEFEFVSVNGRHLASSLIPIMDERNTVLRLLGLAQDITGRKQVEKELRDNRRNLQALIENADSSIWSLDRDYRLIIGNQLFFGNMARLIGHDIQPGDSLLDAGLSQSVMDEWQVYYDRALAGESFSIETVRPFARDLNWVAEYRFSPFRDENGQIVGATVFGRDVTETRRLEKLIRRSEANLRAMFNSAAYDSTLIGLDRRVMDVGEKSSNAAIAVFGKPMLPGDSIYDYVLAQDRNNFDANFEHATRGERVITEKSFPTGDGAERIFSYEYYPVEDRAGDIIGVCLSRQDVTATRQAEAALRESEARFRILSDNALVGVYIVQNGLLSYVNAALAKIFGYDIEALIGADPLVLIHPDDRSRVQENIRRRIEGEIESIQYEFRGRCKDGTTNYVEVFGSRIDLGGHSAVMGNIVDITGRKQAEIALRQVQEQNRLIVQAANVGLWDWNLKTNAVYYSAEWKRQLGYEEAEIDHDLSAWERLTHPDDLPKVLRQVNSYIAQPETNIQTEFRMLHKDGTYRWILSQGSILEHDQHEPAHMVGVHMDITDRKIAEMELRFHSEILRNVAEGIHLTRVQDGIMVYTNPTLERMFGYAAGELLGKHVSVLNAPTVQDPMTIANQIMNGLRETGMWEGEVHNIRKDGKTFWSRGTISQYEHAQFGQVWITVQQDITERKLAEAALHIKDSAIQTTITAIAIADLDGHLTYVNPAFVKMWKLAGEAEALGRSVLDFWEEPQAAQAVIQSIQDAGSYHGQMIARAADGSNLQVDLAASVVYDPDGRPICMMGSFHDVTQRFQAEQLQLEQERLKANLRKEKEFNRLVQKAVSALAHDVRTPLTVISNAKDLLDRYYDRMDEEKRREKLDSIGKQLHFVVQILNDMSLTVKGTLDQRSFEPAPIHLATLCKVSLDEVRESVGANHHLTFVADDTIQVVYIDETLISRILLNLLSNAIKFSPEQSEICLELSRSGKWIVIRVRDEGIGISETALPYIFEPFYRAEEVQKIGGTGLGLNIVKECVERHNGRIHVASQPGKGTEFTVELPLIEAY